MVVVVENRSIKSCRSLEAPPSLRTACPRSSPPESAARPGGGVRGGRPSPEGGGASEEAQGASSK
eukprot:9376956-Pyramimonas_sp.AAC.1